MAGAKSLSLYFSHHPMVAIIILCFFFIFLAPHALCRNIKHKDLIVKKSPFEFLNNLYDSRKHDRVEGLHRVKEYLNQFGYLDTLDFNKNDVFDNKLESAIKTYQLNYKLDTTGILDFRPVSTMMTPRCGVPDIINGTNTMYRGTNPLDNSKFTLFESGRTWGAKNLVYRFETDFPTHLMEPIRYAFDIWANKTRFYFERLLDDDFYGGYSDLSLAYVLYDHGDGSPFDGRGGKLAHAFKPTDGRVHFDASEDWIVGSLPRTLDIVSIAVHEIGHALGLDHKDIPDAIMFPHFRYGMVKRTLHQDDIDGINTLYGWN